MLVKLLNWFQCVLTHRKHKRITGGCGMFGSDWQCSKCGRKWYT